MGFSTASIPLIQYHEVWKYETGRISDSYLKINSFKFKSKSIQYSKSELLMKYIERNRFPL